MRVMYIIIMMYNDEHDHEEKDSRLEELYSNSVVYKVVKCKILFLQSLLLYFPTIQVQTSVGSVNNLPLASSYAIYTCGILTGEDMFVFKTSKCTTGCFI